MVVKKGDISAEQILTHCDDKLARFKTPKHVEFIDEIPRNPTGKVLKAKLRELYSEPKR